MCVRVDAYAGDHAGAVGWFILVQPCGFGIFSLYCFRAALRVIVVLKDQFWVVAHAMMASTFDFSPSF